MVEPVIHVHELEKQYRVWTHAPPTNLKERVRLAGAALRARTGLGERQQFRHDVSALRGVSFDVHRGEVLGVIGRNGAGKSTLLSILARITEPSGGYAEIRGRVSSLLEVGTGFHPELSGRDNVFLNGAILGMARAETEAKFDEIVEFSGIRDFIDIPVKRYSSGMQVRLAFAVGAHLDPEILLLDEVLAVGDAAFQARCHARVEELTRSGRTVVFVSHDVRSVTRLCERAILLEDGLIRFAGPAEEAVDLYLGSSGRREEPAKSERDRPGSGEVRVRRLRIEPANGARVLNPGMPFRLVVDLHASRPTRLDQLAVAVFVEQPGAGAYVVLASDGRGGPLPRKTFEGPISLACETEGMPLKPATYVLTATVRREESLLDRFSRAAELTLVPDLVGTSGVPPAYHAPVVVRNEWTLAATAADDPPKTVVSGSTR
jgi:homopolymeric O-antigen transport system ATP-binding protein